MGEGAEARVGYKIRFSDRSRPGIPIKLMTDGILLAEAQADPLLRQYDTIILDEAHERSLNIDFLMGYLKELLGRRADLRLIITSATLDAAKFAAHFRMAEVDAPIFEVSGRLYPVSLVWRPPTDLKADLIDRVVEAVDAALEDWSGTGPGDVLVFLPGEREIRACADALADQQRRDLAAGLSRGPRRQFDILPLFARLAQADQNRIFQPTGRRRVVLATNIAETSLTVPGIRTVIDSGLARVKRYRVKGKVEQLQIEPISQAQAAQRAGRAGRLAPGVCIRLYDEQDFLARPFHPDPEIHRSSLASVILKMKALGLADVERFPFIDPPSKKAVADGLALLRELEALAPDGQLSEVGQQLARLPMDPRLARMLVAARQMGCLREVVIIVSALSVQDPKDRPMDQQAAADQSHRRFADERSEFLSWVRLWDWIELAFEQKESNRRLDGQLRSAFLSPIRVREWRDVHRQVRDAILAEGWRENERPADYASLHRALITGLLSNIGCRIEEPGLPLWQGTHEVKFAVWPGAMLSKKPARWLMAAEQQETSRLFARTVAAIEPTWLEAAASHLIRVSTSEPHWERKAGRAVGYARGTLYGLPIFVRRRVSWAGLGSAQAEEARLLLIREGLVAQDMDCSLPFFRHNQTLIREVEKLEQRARRQDLLVDESLLEAFYDQALPAEVVDRDSLEAWWREQSRSQPKLLFLSRDDLMRHEAAGITTDQFPRRWDLGSLSLALDYRFEPGSAEDGLQVTVPLAALNQLDAHRLDWLVPGMRKEKVLTLLKSLPQRHRRHCVPLPDYAEAFCQRWQSQAGSKSLVKALQEDIGQAHGVSVALDDFRQDTLLTHHRALIRLVDEHGRQLAAGRDLQSLRDQFGRQAQQAFAPSTDETAYRDWDFGPIASPMELSRGGQTLLGYPALEDGLDHVRLLLLDDPDKAQRIHLRGLCRLFALQLKEPLRALEKDLSKNHEIGIGWLALGEKESAFDQISLLALRRAFLADDWPQTAEAFRQRLAEGRPRVLLLAQEAARGLQSLLAELATVQKRLAGLKSNEPLTIDLKDQLARLLPKGFLLELPDERSRHLPRYLKAMTLRMDKARVDPARELARRAEVQAVEQPFWRWAKTARGTWPAAMTEFRWLLEELRVASFAQELKTPSPVSAKRLEKAWGNLQKELF